MKKMKKILMVMVAIVALLTSCVSEDQSRKMTYLGDVHAIPTAADSAVIALAERGNLQNWEEVSLLICAQHGCSPAETNEHLKESGSRIIMEDRIKGFQRMNKSLELHRRSQVILEKNNARIRDYYIAKAQYDKQREAAEQEYNTAMQKYLVGETIVQPLKKDVGSPPKDPQEEKRAMPFIFVLVILFCAGILLVLGAIKYG